MRIKVASFFALYLCKTNIVYAILPTHEHPIIYCETSKGVPLYAYHDQYIAELKLETHEKQIGSIALDGIPINIIFDQGCVHIYIEFDDHREIWQLKDFKKIYSSVKK